MARLLSHFRIDPGRRDAARMPFLASGPVEMTLDRPLTLIVGENGSGKTTLLAAIATRLGIRPGGGDSYQEYEDEREKSALAETVSVQSVKRLRGVFLRADRFNDIMDRAGRLPMATTGEWRLAEEQSRGEGVLSLMAARLEGSEQLLFLLDEPETGLSPARQMALLCLLDALHRDGRSQAIVATHSPILMSHPEADLLWVDQYGIERRPLVEIPHWRDMRRFMRDPEGSLKRLLED